MFCAPALNLRQAMTERERGEAFMFMASELQSIISRRGMRWQWPRQCVSACSLHQAAGAGPLPATCNHGDGKRGSLVKLCLWKH